jgi:hypothetical protein
MVEPARYSQELIFPRTNDEGGASCGSDRFLAPAQPMNLDNLARRVIQPAIEKCGICKLSKDEHKTDGHLSEQDKNLPVWRGWHAFRRGLATNLHALGIADKEIQAILRHSNITVTQSCYIKAFTESQVSAMDLVGEEFENSSIN